MKVTVRFHPSARDHRAWLWAQIIAKAPWWMIRHRKASPRQAVIAETHRIERENQAAAIYPLTADELFSDE